MIIQPKVRGFICTTAHPKGCAKRVEEDIQYVENKGEIANGPKRVLVIGASTGYGLASRIVSAFGCHASTIGVFFEKSAEGKRTGTAGWYNSVAFEEKAKEYGLYFKSFNGDAYSDEIREQVIETIKKDWGGVDLIVYSLASPRRQHPKTGKVSKSVLKPIGASYTNQSMDMSTNELETVTLEGASEEEIEQTVAVMGGEDWEYWIDALDKEGLLNDGVNTVAYSYVGPEVTQAVYRGGTIGRAKDHLEATAKKLDERLKEINGRAVVSVNKALVTQSSSAIPFIPLYFIILNKVMNEKNVNEDCIQQIYRLFSDKLYSGGNVEVDEDGLIRLDDFELREDIQQIVKDRWDNLTPENFKDVADLEGYNVGFLKLFGFGYNGVDYGEDIDPDQKLLSAAL